MDAIAGVLSYSGNQPIVSAGNNNIVQPSAGNVVYAGFSPTVQATANKWISPTSGDMVYDGGIAFISQPSFVQPGSGVMIYQGLRPVVNDGGELPEYFIELSSPIKTDYDCISPMGTLDMDSPIIDFVNLKSPIYDN